MSNQGFYSIYELLELTKGMTYFRYFPRASGFDPSDNLCCACRVLKGSPKKLKKNLEKEYEGKFPELNIDFQDLPGEKVVNVTIRNGENWDDLKKHHFELTTQLESDLKEKAPEMGFELALPGYLEEFGFRPELFEK